jgi:hypothetical protein
VYGAVTCVKVRAGVACTILAFTGGLKG